MRIDKEQPTIKGNKIQFGRRSIATLIVLSHETFFEQDKELTCWIGCGIYSPATIPHHWLNRPAVNGFDLMLHSQRLTVAGF